MLHVLSSLNIKLVEDFQYHTVAMPSFQTQLKECD